MWRNKRLNTMENLNLFFFSDMFFFFLMSIYSELWCKELCFPELWSLFFFRPEVFVKYHFEIVRDAAKYLSSPGVIRSAIISLNECHIKIEIHEITRAVWGSEI